MMNVLSKILIAILFLVGWSCKDPYQVQPRQSLTGEGRLNSSNASEFNQQSTGFPEDRVGRDEDDKRDRDDEDEEDRDRDDEDEDDEDGGLFDDEDEDEDDEDAKIEYPLLSFAGKGYTTYELKDRLSMTMTIETQIDDDLLTLDQTAARALCSGISGCKQKEVDEQVQASSIGANRYTRLTEKEREDFDDWVRYSIFATRLNARNGIRFDFGKPLPVYPWPAPKARYEDATAAGKSWTATITADRDIDNRGIRTRTFTATITVKKVGESGDEVRLEYSLNIPEDREGNLYKAFPIPKIATYTIDTEERDVRVIDQTSWTYGNRSKQREETVLTFKLCKKKTSRDTDTFPCE